MALGNAVGLEFTEAFEFLGAQLGLTLTAFETQLGFVLTVLATLTGEQEGVEEATFLQSAGLQSAGLQFCNCAVVQFVAFSPQKILHHSGEQLEGF